MGHTTLYFGHSFGIIINTAAKKRILRLHGILVIFIIKLLHKTGTLYRTLIEILIGKLWSATGGYYRTLELL